MTIVVVSVSRICSKRTINVGRPSCSFQFVLYGAASRMGLRQLEQLKHGPADACLTSTGSLVVVVIIIDACCSPAFRARRRSRHLLRVTFMARNEQQIGNNLKIRWLKIGFKLKSNFRQTHWHWPAGAAVAVAEVCKTGRALAELAPESRDFSADTDDRAHDERPPLSLAMQSTIIRTSTAAAAAIFASPVLIITKLRHNRTAFKVAITIDAA